MSENYITVAEKRFPVLVAISTEEQQRGLMYRDPPLPNMLFIYSSPCFAGYWMANVRSDLDIVHCLDGKILSINRGESYSTKVIGGYIQTDMVIEFPYGICRDNKIQIGDFVKLNLNKEAQMRVLALKTGFNMD